MAAPLQMEAQVFFLAVFVVLSVWGQNDDIYEGQRTFTLEHNLGEGFVKRGIVVVKSVKGNRANLAETTTLTNEEKALLKNLVAEQDIYRLRLVIRQTGSDEEDSLFSYVPACAVAESYLTDHIWIHFDQSGEVIGFSVTTSPSQCQGIKIDNSYLEQWNSSLDITQTVQGPAPDTMSYVEKMKREEEKSKGQQPDNRSFIAKYWMYIVPFVLFMLLASGAEPQGEGGGQGGGGGR